ncbi:hypothetical protein AUJ14_00980 [Candidatus Micrarchaeota archaeon CG1_02_55_22]|nr:MAG: hypothetical protein AUJ14_00980 [Candidatus Micrarchaeota archaeon CG1_02_55_22]
MTKRNKQATNKPPAAFKPAPGPLFGTAHPEVLPRCDKCGHKIEHPPLIEYANTSTVFRGPAYCSICLTDNADVDDAETLDVRRNKDYCVFCPESEGHAPDELYSEILGFPVCIECYNRLNALASYFKHREDRARKQEKKAAGGKKP